MKAEPALIRRSLVRCFAASVLILVLIAFSLGTSPQQYARPRPSSELTILEYCSAQKAEALQLPEQGLTRYEYERPEMGMPFRIVLYAGDPATAKAAADAA